MGGSRTSLTFLVTPDETGGFSERCLSVGIFTQGETFDELRANVREAVECHFFDRLPNKYYVELIGQPDGPMTTLSEIRVEVGRMSASWWAGKGGRRRREGHLLVDEVMAGVRKRHGKDTGERQKGAFRVNQSAIQIGIYALARYI
jgi:predicted RNase H-like HicB family nuclease